MAKLQLIQQLISILCGKTLYASSIRISSIHSPQANDYFQLGLKLGSISQNDPDYSAQVLKAFQQSSQSPQPLFALETNTVLTALLDIFLLVIEATQDPLIDRFVGDWIKKIANEIGQASKQIISKEFGQLSTF